MVDATMQNQGVKSILTTADDLAETNKFLKDALVESKREGLVLAAKARFAALSVVGLLLIYLDTSWSVLYYEALIAAFMLNGWAQSRIGKVGRSRSELLLLALDLALMTVTLLVPNPFNHDVWSVGLQYKYGGFSFFYILLAGASLAYSWRTMFAVIWFTTLVWGLGYFWATFQPDVIPEISEQLRILLVGHPRIIELLDPADLHFSSRVQEVVVFGVVAGILALNSWRSNRLLIRQAEAARERSNLSRYFAPTMVEHLAGRDQPLGEVRSQKVVVMFADIVGFTKMAEREKPEDVVAILREFHGMMETAVFEHKGTLDKFLGDGLMVSFGTPNTSPDDAKNALQCAVEMQKQMTLWNQSRVAAGEKAIRLSVGLHYGDVILGDIGSERRLEYTVLGDAVNVASRLEALTRKLGASVAASSAVMQAAGMDADNPFSFEPVGPQPLRGREEPVDVWTIKLDS